MTPIEHLQQRAKDLHLYGLLAHWHELADSGWVEQLPSGKKPNGPSVAWSDVWAARISAVSSPSPTLRQRSGQASTGTGRSNATGPPSANC